MNYSLMFESTDKYVHQKMKLNVLLNKTFYFNQLDHEDDFPFIFKWEEAISYEKTTPNTLRRAIFLLI